jgi:GNAT superfamily N-acetyltransferase
VIEVRAVEDDELELWVGVHNRVDPRPQTSEEVRAYREECEAATLVLAYREETPVGAGSAFAEPLRRARGVAFGTVAVLSGERRRGVGTSLLRDVSAWSARHELDRLEGYVAEDDVESLAWAARRGFTEVGRESLLALDLSQIEAPVPDPPAGVEITTLAARPELAHGLYEVACESVPDVPGQEDEIERFEDWFAHDMSGPNDRADSTFVALSADGEVIGYAKFHLPQARPAVAAHDLTAVRRAWRGRGLAGALKATQIAWAKEAGYERLETFNEVRNAPIRRLNERFGYRPAAGRVLVRGPFSG